MGIVDVLHELGWVDVDDAVAAVTGMSHRLGVAIEAHVQIAKDHQIGSPMIWPPSYRDRDRGGVTFHGIRA